MKKLISCAMLVMSMFVFTACPSDSDDDDNNFKSNQQSVVKPGIFGNKRVTSTPEFSYSYRSDGSVEKASRYREIYNFSEDGKTISQDQGDGDGYHTWDLTYNAQGLVSEIAYTHPKKPFDSYTAVLTYDKKKRLQMIKGATYGGEGEIKLFWEDDCIVAGGYGADPNGVGYGIYRNFYTFTYSDKKYVNKYRQYSPAEADMLYNDFYSMLAYLGLLGVGSAYCPDTYTWFIKMEYSDEVGDGVHKASYSFNEEGLIDRFDTFSKYENYSYTYSYENIVY